MLLKKMANLKINTNLLPMKAQYFLWNAGTGPVIPYITVYARQLGFSTFIVGIVYTVLPVLGMLAKPIFGAIADRYHIQKALFLFFQILTAVSLFSVQFIPKIPASSAVTLECGPLTYFKACNEETIDHCTNSTLINEVGSNGVFTCKFACSTKNNSLAHEVCSTWIDSDNCSNENFFDVEFLGTVPMEHMEKWGSCFHFRINATYFGEITKDHRYIPYCKNFTRTTCSISCDYESLNAVVEEPSVTDSNTPSLYQFWLLFMLLIFGWVGMAVVVSVGDAICFGMLGDKPSHYGYQRMWGAVGWGTLAFTSGFLIDTFSSGQVKKDYTVMFYLLLVFIIIDFLVSLKLKYKHTKMSPSIIRDVGSLVKDVRICVFFLWCIAVGLATGLQWQFLFWYLEDLAASEDCDMKEWIKTLQGLVTVVDCFGGELPFFFVSGFLLKKIGHINAMSLVLGAFGVRFILYSILTNPWWVLPIELLQGITFGIFFATMASYASIVAPSGTETTMQGLVGAIFEGVGVSLGSLFGGMLYNQSGGSFTFLCYGIGMLVLFVLHVIVQFFLSRKSSNPHLNLRDFNNRAMYAPPNEAVCMLSDDQQER